MERREFGRIKMDVEKLKEKIKKWHTNPDEYIKLFEEMHGVKFYWYQKLILKKILKSKKRKTNIHY